jgi:predicted N-acetyltransferase YhbS
MNLQVRKALESDANRIADVVFAAFGEAHGDEITDLISGLLTDPSAQPLLSLVATVNGDIVGHILFTTASVKNSQHRVSAAILAPLAVHPNQQNQGIGGLLIKEGLRQMKAAGVELVFVLGHPGYYPRHGFSAAGIKGFDAPYPIPPENAAAWMVQELSLEIAGHASGRVICANTLNDPKYWQE